ncbi:hypothetical protein WICMUC_001309 [Wickerhamomyces mucosus]|uniref:Uncharacterized protein n=1 Tax=Wickerhamomyces mucosus TaxID=1378264 RepID=A0A9P8THM7_9ASCO|nr:hypothetical protein WICMUC_001309 [Wickerhamomyces mucosus]
MTVRKLSDESESETDNESLLHATKKSKTSELSTLKNLYLDTINRKVLDFDFEKVCSQTLSNKNIYCCLVCGKYFSGRSSTTPCFLHSINENHHIFVNFNNLKVYNLPENYEIEGDQFNDIKIQIKPEYTALDINDLQKGIFAECRDLNGKIYTQSVLGLNNLKENDYSNVIIQALVHIPQLRDYYLLKNDDKNGESRDELERRFLILMKKFYSKQLFKAHLSPHEFLQYVSVISKKKFLIHEKGTPNDFLIWLLNNLNQHSKIFSRSFQGKLEILTRTQDSSKEEDIKVQKFWELNLELPSMSILKDEAIPQIQIYSLLDKYTANFEQVVNDTTSRIFKIIKFPNFLVMNINRFKDFHLGVSLSIKERNKTIIEFPLELQFNQGTIKYKLISNIVHYELNLKSHWKIQLNVHDNWYEIDNLEIKEKEKEFLFLSESCLQIWQRIK